MKQKDQKSRKVMKERSENPPKEPANPAVLVEAIRKVHKAAFTGPEWNVFVQYFYMGCSHRDIAENLGTCKKRVIFLKKKAIKKMKKTLPEFPYRLFKDRRRELLNPEVYVRVRKGNSPLEEQDWRRVIRLFI